MSTTTSRLNLTQPVGTDSPSVLRTALGAATTTLDAAVLVTEGALAARPVTSTVEKDHVYKATDTGQWFISDGTNWNTMLVAGPWTNITLGFNVIAGSGYAPTVRQQGDEVRLRGTAKYNTTGTTVSVGTIPSGFRPASNVGVVIPFDNGTLTLATIFVSGAITLATALPNGVTAYLDGVVFSLT